MINRILPAYPLFVKDPNFSFWSNGEILNESEVIFWTGATKTVVGVLSIDKEEYVFLGKADRANKILQTNISVTAYTTEYQFENEKVILNVKFVSPLPLDDKRLLSCPVCYMQYSITKKVACETKISVAFNGDVCFNRAQDFYNTDRLIDKRLRGKVFSLNGFQTAWVGLKRQAPLSYSHDNSQADWGYWYLGGENCYMGNLPYRQISIQGDSEIWIKAENESETGNILIGFDDIVSISYFGEYLPAYYFKDGKTIIDALTETWNNIPVIDGKLDLADKKLCQTCEGHAKEYRNILYASLRQSIAAHKLVENRKGELLWLSKECFSNGCIATVDVSYPSIPLYLLADTEYVKGMLRPIFAFARMPVWKYDFSPHDVGTYPICSGQVYGIKDDKNLDDTYLQSYSDFYKYPFGGDDYLEDMQMPVEECANMLIMSYACYVYDHDERFLRENYDLLEKWIKYLVRYGLKPEYQLCTDDFAGHLKNNINLAIKATVGIACFAEIEKVLNKNSGNYRGIAEDYAAKIEECGKNFAHLPLTWDSDDATFSLKYNLAFDKILNLNVFKKETREREIDCYLSKMNRYGTPLDTRKSYTKSDWLMWAASLTDDKDKRNIFIEKIDEFLKNSPDRLPFGDWFESETGEIHSFRNRSVQGACFILLMK